jgi:hypothetical protein
MFYFTLKISLIIIIMTRSKAQDRTFPTCGVTCTRGFDNIGTDFTSNPPSLSSMVSCVALCYNTTGCVASSYEVVSPFRCWSKMTLRPLVMNNNRDVCVMNNSASISSCSPTRSPTPSQTHTPLSTILPSPSSTPTPTSSSTPTPTGSRTMTATTSETLPPFISQTPSHSSTPAQLDAATGSSSPSPNVVMDKSQSLSPDVAVGIAFGIFFFILCAVSAIFVLMRVRSRSALTSLPPNYPQNSSLSNIEEKMRDPIISEKQSPLNPLLLSKGLPNVIRGKEVLYLDGEGGAALIPGWWPFFDPTSGIRRYTNGGEILDLPPYEDLPSGYDPREEFECHGGMRFFWDHPPGYPGRRLMTPPWRRCFIGEKEFYAHKNGSTAWRPEYVY